MHSAEGLWLRHSLIAVVCGCRVPRDQFFQFSWRPRAPTLLPKEQEAEIAKHLKDYSKRYDEIDSKLLQEVCRPCMTWLRIALGSTLPDVVKAQSPCRAEILLFVLSQAVGPV